MRAAAVATLALFLTVGAGQAELKIPRGVFKMEELSEAKAKAAESDKPLVFVYTDPGTT